MTEFLSRILATKEEEVAVLKQQRSLEDLKNSIRDLPPVRGLASSLKVPGISIIAEVKKASPSAGVLAADFDHRSIGRDYEAGGAAALSVLTDKKYFQGTIEFLQDIRSVTALPILRKDFVIHEYQIYETRAAGGDAVLLIARLLDQKMLLEFYESAASIGLETLVEVHDEKDIEKANNCGAAIIGINNRNLSDFSVSIDRSLRLRPLLHDGAIAVSESGIRRKEDVKVLRDAGFDAILVGEGLVTKGDRQQAIRELRPD
ncbi:MAG TPA: indole-3-glycerol phosphate synthase TrpC [Bacteroidota bacterium]|nr:indole-3-glycerol phosphate synthase TrpC [Bacteroidota bacterium]